MSYGVASRWFPAFLGAILSLAALAPAEIPTLSEALDTQGTGLEWWTGASYGDGWGAETEYSRVGGAAAQAPLDFAPSNWIYTKAEGPGTLTFDCSISSDPDVRFLKFHADGDNGLAFTSRLAPPPNWATHTAVLGPGTHTFVWNYERPLGFPSPRWLGHAWLDNVRWVPGRPSPWRQALSSGPTPTTEVNLAYDPVAQGVMMVSGPPPLSDPLMPTWRWTGRDWAKAFDGPMPFLQYFSMATDTKRNKVVLFGGAVIDQTEHTNPFNTWEWDGRGWQQIRTSSRPYGLYSVMAYDEARGRIVVFSGDSSTSSVGETWTWDGATWELVTSSGPRARTGAAMGYDPVRERVVLYGGGPSNGFYYETWEWDGSTWTNVTSVIPPPRYNAQMAFDATRGKLLLFGGAIYTTEFADTWEWDGVKWTQLDAPGPSSAQPCSMVTDRKTRKIVLYVGPERTTWEWDGSNWSKLEAQPSPRTYQAMAADPVRGRTILFGGRDSVKPAQALRDTWEWDPQGKWSRPSPAASPSARYGHTLVHDPNTGNDVLFGGTNSTVYFGDTWIWNGTIWSDAQTTTGPSLRSSHAMVAGKAGSPLVLFGGGDKTTLFGDTWGWRNAGWTQLATTGPSPRTGHAMVYDAAHDRTVLFGGYDGSKSLADTWQWDGTAWTELHVAGPTARKEHAMCYDPDRKKVLLLGGIGGDKRLWEWDGTGWAALAGFEFFGPLNAHSLAYDAPNSTVLLYGGMNGSTYLNGMWTTSFLKNNMLILW